MYKLIYNARRDGVHIITKTRTILTSKPLQSRYAKRLVKEHGFSVQMVDERLQPITDKRIYISLPINSTNPQTGKPYDIESQRQYSYSLEKFFRKNGFRTFNPFRNGLSDDAPICDHMRADYQQLAKCDAIIMCPGWEFSSGCKHEFLMAADMRLEILYVHNDNVIYFL